MPLLFRAKRSQDVAGEPTPESPSQSADKALLRRAQVRKAQIQHRQRKANYVKQLEIDVAQFRNLIAGVQRDVDLLNAENSVMRTQIHDAVRLQGHMRLLGEMGGREAGIMMELDFDDVLGAPSFRVKKSPSSEDCRIVAPYMPRTQSHDQRMSLTHGSRSGGPPMPQMTPQQTQLAINFILALEHICWDHFDYSNFQPDTEPTGLESGHTLMASSLALRTAPAAVFDQVIVTKQNMRSSNPVARETPVPPDVSWQASGLTLQSLYGLASSVNPSDMDLTPVQAWFELASQYPMDLLLRADVVDALKVELLGVVKCPHYGAVIEREAFESVVGRVLEPALATWKMGQLAAGGFNE